MFLFYQLTLWRFELFLKKTNKNETKTRPSSPLFPTSINPESQHSPGIVPALLVITIIKAVRICMASFTKSSPSVWVMKSLGGVGRETKLPREQQLNENSSLSPKRVHSSRNPPEQRGCCVFSATLVLYGGFDLSRS